jgi:hypothetical protein
MLLVTTFVNARAGLQKVSAQLEASKTCAASGQQSLKLRQGPSRHAHDTREGRSLSLCITSLSSRYKRVRESAS